MILRAVVNNNNNVFLPADTKSIVQTHTFCTKQHIPQRHWRLNHRVTDTYLTKRFATALEAEPRDYRHILNTIVH